MSLWVILRALPGDAPRFDLYGGRFGECRKTNEKALWARGYFVSSVWLDEAAVRAYIRNQKQEEERHAPMKLIASRLGRLTGLSRL